ncbi:heme o synthase [Bacillus testis]|uniref:heme o synthase n=1 Tax=Bacillus testis TaxID=1622072 RepID=UPI00067E9390|nr:heme o synthase [Bacillus testis]
MSNAKAAADDQSLQKEITKASAWDDFLALIKIGIIKSNLITTFTGMWLALHFAKLGFLNNLDTVFYTLMGTALIIGGAGTINNYIDRDIDQLMERTKARPTVTGKYNASKVLFVGISLVTVGTILLALTTFTAAVLGLIGVFAYSIVYTYSKRKLVSNTIIGSFSGAIPPLIGWAAVEPHLGTVAWTLFLIMFLWQPPHFYALAMRRSEEYRKAGVPMLPVVKGFKRTKISTNLWVLFLMPIPFFLTDLGMPLVILTAVLNIGWLALGLYGFKMKDDIKWAKSMFIYSLNYLTILFVSMVIVTLI